jgi:ABC-type multidrug transport system fused ATPase/permease subunit
MAGCELASFTGQVNDAIDKILSKKETICLFVAHRLSTIARAERIVVLEGKRILPTASFVSTILIGLKVGE